MAMGVPHVYRHISPTGGLKGQVCSLAIRVGGHLALTDFHSDYPSELLLFPLWHYKYRPDIVIIISSNPTRLTERPYLCPTLLWEDFSHFN